MQLAHSAPPERLQCPQHFQRRIAQVGGMNRYRQPNFKLAWAQTETFRQGGEWESEEETYRGYRDCYLGDGLPHWMLLQWADAGKSATIPHLPPESDRAFYAANECPKTGLQILGEYPYHGSYQIVLPLLAKMFVDGQLFIEAFPLSTEIVEMMVPVIKASMELSLEAKMLYMKEQNEKDDDEFSRTVDDVYSGIRRKKGLASTAWLEDKQRSIEKHFNSALVTMMARNRRFQSQRQVV